MRIHYQSQTFSFGGSTTAKYINFNSTLGLKLNPVTDNPSQRVPGNMNYIGTTLRYYNGTSWVVLQDIRNKLASTLDKQDSASTGAGDFRIRLDAAYPLPSFYPSIIDSSGYYKPDTMTSSYLTVVGSTPTWKQWTSNSWPNGGDPDSLWGCHINFKTRYIRWGGHVTFTGTIKFSHGWNVGFENNQLRVFNVANPVQAGDAVNRAYSISAVNSIATSTESIFASTAEIERLHNQLKQLYEDAVANTTNPNELATLIEIVRKYQ